MTGGDEVPVCPECDSTRVWRTNDRGFVGQGRDYYCHRCYAGFDDPEYRERKSSGTPGANAPLVQALIDADPSEVGS